MTSARERDAAPAPEGEAGGYPGHIPFPDKVSFGFGQYGEGLQGSAALALLLFFYSQVIGLNAAVVGAGILLTGLVNGLIDSFIGSWSDVTRSRWGRRHPYLYLAPLPAGLGMVMLFSPPAMPPWAMFVWLFFWYTVMRTGMTVYLVPHWALGAELSRDYHERTSLASSRIFFSFLGSGSFFIISILFFNPRQHSSVSLLKADNYLYLVIAISVAVVASELWSAFATRRYIPHLPIAPPDAKALTFRVLWREVRGVFSNKAFSIFFAGSAIMAAGSLGLKALEIYMGVYFWRLPSNLTLILPGLSTLAFAVGTFFWAAISRRVGKKDTFIAGVVGYGLIMSCLPIFKIAGIFVSPDSALYFPIILAVSMIGSFIMASYAVMSGAILPDVVDDYFRQTGRRMAGIITGFLYVISTIAAAGSQLVAGVVLTLIGLAPKALPDAVPLVVSNRLGLVSGIVAAIMAAAFVVVFRRYPISDHASRRSAG
jgi:Na+/melibiose symporter-like transporter